MKGIIETLKVLNEGENYLVQVKDYARIGNKTVDEFDMFERSSVAVPTPFELIGNENRLNISVQNKIYGVVTLNPKQAKRVGLPTEIKTSMMFRTKTIIRDGKLNAEEMELIIDTQTYLMFKKNGLNFQELTNETTYPGFHIILTLTGMPIVEGKMVDYTLDEILENVTKINTLKAKQKVLNALTKQLPDIKEDVIPGFTQEQSDVLRDHGLDEKLQYVGVSPKVEDAEEVYTGDVIEFKVKGSSMNSFKEVLNRVAAGKKLNALDTVQYEYYTQLTEKVTNMGITDAEDLRMLYKADLKKIKGEMFGLKLRNTMIKLAFTSSPLNEIAFDTTGEYAYKGMLTISFTGKEFTK